jgi:hypothetical protein
MKAILILVYAVVLLISTIKVIFGYPLWWVAIFMVVISFAFIDWDNVPWLKFRLKSN